MVSQAFQISNMPPDPPRFLRLRRWVETTQLAREREMRTNVNAEELNWNTGTQEDKQWRKEREVETGASHMKSSPAGVIQTR